ncbi:MAG: phage tail protein [Saprospiraceae bacterium]|nr:phage tail protein [Saprospiraceae bacterium]
MLTFGLICEGESDQIVIENILFGVFEDPDLFTAPLQPPPGISGSFDQVFNYCCSTEFKQGINDNDFYIVQIDTDVIIKGQLQEKYRIDLPPTLKVDEMVKRVVDKFISLIGEGNNFWEEYGHKVIFAISVHEIECWLLPVYYKDGDKKKAAKITGCIEALNKAVNPKHGWTIHAKERAYYETMSKPFRKEISKLHKLNPSLEIFVEHLMTIKTQQ